MDKKDRVIEIKRHYEDFEYYNNVFKKVEKISSVIFYILSFKKDDQEKSLLEKTLEEKSFKLHEVSLTSLQSHIGQTESLDEVYAALTSVSSTLSVATIARSVTSSLSAPILEQIDTVQRYLANHYLTTEPVTLEASEVIAMQGQTATKPSSSSTARERKASATPRARRVAVPAGDISSDAYLVYSQLNDRSERIKTVLEAKPQATVKDIAEIITDVSEKTIQRDLNSLIEQGQVVREGERRWSKYSVIKD